MADKQGVIPGYGIVLRCLLFVNRGFSPCRFRLASWIDKETAINRVDNSAMGKANVNNRALGLAMNTVNVMGRSVCRLIDKVNVKDKQLVRSKDKTNLIGNMHWRSIDKVFVFFRLTIVGLVYIGTRGTWEVISIRC